MTHNCPDDSCSKKIQAIDCAIGHDKNNWFVILDQSDDVNDVANALRFCETLKLEAKVKVTTNGYRVLIRDDLIRFL
ncbi:MAG: hypothetical protein ACFFAY_03675 [Promethearchaeota archaeon]